MKPAEVDDETELDSVQGESGEIRTASPLRLSEAAEKVL